MLSQLTASVLQPPLEPPEVALQLPPILSPAKRTGGAGTNTAGLDCLTVGQLTAGPVTEQFISNGGFKCQCELAVKPQPVSVSQLLAVSWYNVYSPRTLSVLDGLPQPPDLQVHLVDCVGPDVVPCQSVCGAE